MLIIKSRQKSNNNILRGGWYQLHYRIKIITTTTLLLLSLSTLQNNTTFRFSSLVYGLYAKLCFSGTWIDRWLINNNVIFLCLRFIFACFFVLYLYGCAVENSEISGFCASEIRAQCVQTINGWRELKRCVVL